jgi:hypothetical protein
MHYSRKIAIAVLAGAAASGVVVANRKAISRLLPATGRKKAIKKLNDWRQPYMERIDSYSPMEARQYVDDHREFLASLARRKGYTGGAVDRFVDRVRADVQELIVVNHKSYITKKYADYLHKVDRKHSLHADEEARDYTLRADELLKKLHEKGCHTDSLLTTLHVTPPE